MSPAPLGIKGAVVLTELHAELPDDAYLSAGSPLSGTEFARGGRGYIADLTFTFLLNPPAAPRTDTDVVERHTVVNILAALEGAKLEKVVAESTGGAKPGSRIGNLNVLWELEEGLRTKTLPKAVNRAAYYMSNWDRSLETVRHTGLLQSLFPAHLAIPMVAPQDLGEIAAARLMSGPDDRGVRYMEGPRPYTPHDVARAFAQALHRPVEVQVVPREKWQHVFIQPRLF
ncbi:hypothetical protein [Achromobacter insolitus]|uniref:hypothetical protein n=1 Tax=Achromobacter insolitus TaxID=217204 RepID=UPI00174BA7E0|nr:hypothetical protein [Achromobacter insolitus]